MSKDFDAAIASFKKAVLMDPSDPFDIQSELQVCEKHAAAKEKQRLDKLSGFLKNGL